MRMLRQVLALLLVASLLAGCVVRRSEVVRMRGADSPAAGPVADASDHIVVRGDTLYSIAFRNRVDWRDVAAWNRLPAPYTIYPGQRLRLRPADASLPVARTPAIDAEVAQTQPLREAPPIPVPTPPAAAPPPASTPAPSAPVPSRPVETVPPPPPTVAPSPAATTPSAPEAVPPAPIASSPTSNAGGLQWRWPTQGEVVQRYSTDAARQGIAIAGRSGQAVVAAADGEVVYSGSGLRGYGELIIIKHSAEYLSAYGHNRKRLVNEGERVRAGQPIAELGRTGTDRDKLHFEIRRGGRPIDPMGFLPRR